MISEILFIQIINKIQEQDKINEKFSKSLETVCDSYCFYGYKDKKYESLLLLLKEIFQDKDDWILWWLYDYHPDKKLKAFYKNNKEIKLETSENLYRFLIKNIKKRSKV